MNQLTPKDSRLLDTLGSGALIQLVYASTPLTAVYLRPTLLDKVESQAQRTMQLKNVTSILCYGRCQFLQCLEGEKDLVLSVFSDIRKDKRHKNIKLLLIKPILMRRLPNLDTRLLVLEPWLWSHQTKQHTTALAAFLPFKPHSWSAHDTERFIDTMLNIETCPYLNSPIMTLNIWGNKIRNLIGLHQAFIVVQTILGILLLIAIVLICNLNAL